MRRRALIFVGIFFGVSVFGGVGFANPEKSANSLTRLFAYQASGKGRWLLEATEMKDDPALVEGVCFRLGQFVQSLETLRTAHVYSGLRGGVGLDLHSQAQNQLSSRCGGIAAQKTSPLRGELKAWLRDIAGPTQELVNLLDEQWME